MCSLQFIKPNQAPYNPLQTLLIPFLITKDSFDVSPSIVVEIVTHNWLKAIGQIRRRFRSLNNIAILTPYDP